jgi:hypothetical protein
MESEEKKQSRLEEFGREVGRTMGNAADRLEKEAERTIRYLNEEVVPAIRTHSSSALRKAADQLRRLADYMDEARRAS